MGEEFQRGGVSFQTQRGWGWRREGRQRGGGGGGISPLTEVAAAAATLRLAGNGLAFFPSFFPSSNNFFRFPSDLEIISLALLFIEFFVYIFGSSKMVHG